MPWYVYQSIFEIFAKFILLFPRSQLLTVQVSLFPFPVVWPGLYLCLCIGSLRFSGWLSGSVDHLLCACSWLSAFRSTCCLLDLSAWVWFSGFPSWWYGVIPARFVLLHFFIPFHDHLFTFYLRPHAMLLVLQLVGDRLVFLQGCYWGRGIIVLVLPVA